MLSITIILIVVSGICLMSIVCLFVYTYLNLKSIDREIKTVSSLDSSQIDKLRVVVTQAMTALDTLKKTNFNDTTEVGVVMAYAGTTIPNAYMLCDGAQLLISSYPDLFVRIGTTFNQPTTDSSLYFNLPDLRSMFIRGHDLHSKRPIGSFEMYSTAMPHNQFSADMGGLHSHVMSTSGNHSHSIQFKLAKQSGSSTACYSTISYNGTSSQRTDDDGQHTHTIMTDGQHTHSIIGGDVETRPANVALNYIIKVINTI